MRLILTLNNAIFVLCSKKTKLTNFGVIKEEIFFFNWLCKPAIRLIKIPLYNWCKMSNNRMVWIFIWQWFYAKHFCGYNQSSNILFCCFIGLFCCFLSYDYVDLCICICYNFLRFFYFCEGTWQIEYYTFTFIPVMRTSFL